MKDVLGTGAAWVMAAALAMATPTHAQATGPGAKIGVLTCWQIAGSKVNLLFTSSAAFDCVFETAPGVRETYKAESGVGIGLDLKWDTTKTIAFAVFSATKDYPMGSYGLAGRFVGATASAAVGAGAGASVLVGGGARNITLQPIAVETGTGAGAAAGIGYLFLEPDPAAAKK